MGTHDVPAFIEKIKTVTGKEKVTYMGHSCGCSQFLAAASLMPDYFKANVDHAVLMAPPTTLAHS